MAKTNRYTRKRKHKQILEKQYANQYHYGRSSPCDVRLLRDKLTREAEEEADSWWYRKHPPRNKGWEYWRIYYLTGMRQFAKKFSDKRIRQKYRQMIKKMDPEDVTAPRGSDYEKEFDYNWTIW